MRRVWRFLNREAVPAWFVAALVFIGVSLVAHRTWPVLVTLSTSETAAILAAVALIALLVQWLQGLFVSPGRRKDWVWAARHITLWLVAALAGIVLALWMQHGQARLVPVGSLHFICPVPEVDAVPPQDQQEGSQKLNRQPVTKGGAKLIPPKDYTDVNINPKCVLVGLPQGEQLSLTAGRADRLWVECMDGAVKQNWRCEVRGGVSKADSDRLLSAGKTGSAKVSTTRKTPSVADGGKPESKPPEVGDKPWDITNFVATVLAVVLTVVLLIATKTAADARSEVREELGRLNAARTARQDAQMARISLFAATLVADQLELARYYSALDAKGAADAKRLADFLRPLSRLLMGLPSLGQPGHDFGHLLGRGTTLLNMQQANPLGSLSAPMLSAELRDRLRQCGDLILGWLQGARDNGHSPSAREEEALDLLDDVAVMLRRI